MCRIGICVCVFCLLVCCVLPLAAQQPTATIYYACVNNSTGALRIVSKTTVCKSTEHKIQWDQTGPQGPKGPPGPQGPPGMSFGAFANNPTATALTTTPTVVAFTNPIQVTGTYYINATALLALDPIDAVICYVTLKSDSTDYGLQGGGSNIGNSQIYAQASIADSRYVFADDIIQLTCLSTVGQPGTQAVNASITAILIDASVHSKKQKHSQHARPQ